MRHGGLDHDERAASRGDEAAALRWVMSRPAPDPDGRRRHSEERWVDWNDEPVRALFEIVSPRGGPGIVDMLCWCDRVPLAPWPRVPLQEGRGALNVYAAWSLEASGAFRLYDLGIQDPDTTDRLAMPSLRNEALAKVRRLAVDFLARNADVVRDIASRHLADSSEEVARRIAELESDLEHERRRLAAAAMDEIRAMRAAPRWRVE